jgi:ribosomal protein S20
MKLLKTATVFLSFFLIAQSAVAAPDLPDRDEALTMFKSYVNTMVQKVEKAKNPDLKRKVMNESFDNIITALDEAVSMGIVSPKDQKAVATLKQSIQEKKNELQGLKGYKRVANKNLNNFANFVQQDLEQADTITFSLSATLLVLIILLLLLL